MWRRCASRPIEGVVLGDVEGVVVPLLHGHEGEVGAVADLDLDVGAALGRRRGA